MSSEREWWCGCEPRIKFIDEAHFIKHMKDKHRTWYSVEIAKLLKEQK